MLTTAVGINSQTGIIFALLGASMEEEQKNKNKKVANSNSAENPGMRIRDRRKRGRFVGLCYSVLHSVLSVGLIG